MCWNVNLNSRFLEFCQNRTGDFRTDSPALWPTKLVLHCLGSEMTLACMRFENQLKPTFGSENPKLWVYHRGCTTAIGFHCPTLVLWGGIQWTGTVPHATWTLTVSLVRDILCCKPPVVNAKVSDFRIHMLVFSDLKTNARNSNFWNRCKQGSFCAPMHATRKAILTGARNGLLGNGCAQGMDQILDARYLHPGCTQPL